MQEPVGFVGLGVMGSAMSGHLLKAGFQVSGHDVDAGRLADHVTRGGSPAASPAAAGAGAKVVITSLPSARALTQVVAGDHGLASLPGELVVMETSTLPIDVKEEARQVLAAEGKTLLDCPLSGTGAQARQKDLVAYLSGDDQAKAKVAPLLRAFTRTYYDVGSFGNGMKMKIVANHLVAIHNLAAAEALVLAERAGLNLEQVLLAVGDGAGTSRMLEVRGPVMVAGDYAVPGIRTQVFAKDVDIIDAFAGAAGVPTPLFSLASVFYRAALAQGRGDEDTACVHAVLRQLATGS